MDGEAGSRAVGAGINTAINAGPLPLEVLRRGAGRPILLLHGINPISPQAPFVEMMAQHGEVIAPSHPGFGHSPLPDDCDTMYDLVNVYLDVLDGMSEKTVVVGFSFGGWLAAELAVSGHPQLDKLVLVDPVGIKLGGREERDIAHFFNTNPRDLNRMAWHDPAKAPAGLYGVGWQEQINDAMTDEDMVLLARNWDSLCLYAWRPHMYNPQLKQWLRRISVPTQVLWGASDGIVSSGYGCGYAALIPGAEFAVIEGAGHHPELEQPQAFVEKVAAFINK